MAAVGRERRLPHLNLTLDLPDTSDCRLRRFPLPPLHPSTSISTEHRLSDFDKLAVLGHGNGGTVCKVRHRRTGAVYALKILQQSSASREIQILRRTDSPSVVRCHAVFPATAGDSALLLEFMDAGSLESVLLRRRRPFPEPALAGIAAQVLRGLSYLHSMNIVHRDIKPANLLANSAGEIKIADFGTGKITGRSLNSCASFVGTCAYMSPERFDPGAHGGSYDAYSADVWSLGLTLLELGVGHFPLLPPGQRPDWAALMCAICFGDSPAAPDSASGEFRDFIRCCLEKDSEKRWSVAQLLAHPFIAGRDRSESERVFKMLLADES